MKTRLLTTAIGIPLAVLIVTVRGIILDLVIVAVMLISLWEYNSALSQRYKVCVIGGYAAAILAGVTALLHIPVNLSVLLGGALIADVIGVVLRREPRFEDMMASVYTLLMALLPWLLAMNIGNRQFGEIPGITFIIMSLTITFATDGFAFFGGRFFGRHKLCPAISPKKTVEGAISGVIFGVIAALVCRVIMIVPLHTPMPGVLPTLCFALIGAVVCQFGDLAASMCKRHVGIKDFGNIIPGHGGVMDRFDGTVMVFIVAYCFTTLL